MPLKLDSHDLASVKAAYCALPINMRYAHFSPEYVLADAHRSTSAKPGFFTHMDEDGIFYHAFQTYEVPDTPYIDIESPYGYGGPLIASDNQDFARKAFAIYREWCRDNHVLVEFIRFHPHLRSWEYYDGETFYNRCTVPVNPAGADEFEGYNATTRNELRKLAKSGLEVKTLPYDEFRDRFIPLYYKTMENANADEFYLFPEPYFRNLASVEPVCIMVINENGDDIGGVIGLRSGEDMEYHLVGTNDEGRRRHAGVFLVHLLRKKASELGCSYLNLGGGTTPDESNPLLKFKKHFSKNIESYNIGKYIPLRQEYEKLRSDWETKTGRRADLIIFYR